jgi:hypothetical protein
MLTLAQHAPTQKAMSVLGPLPPSRSMIPSTMTSAILQTTMKNLWTMLRSWTCQKRTSTCSKLTRMAATACMRRAKGVWLEQVNFVRQILSCISEITHNYLVLLDCFPPDCVPACFSVKYVSSFESLHSSTWFTWTL